MIRLIVEDADENGNTDERFVLEGNYEQLGELYSAMKRMALAMGHFPSNVDEYFSKNEHGDKQESIQAHCGLGDTEWNKSWTDWAKNEEAPESLEALKQWDVKEEDVKPPDDKEFSWYISDLKQHILKKISDLNPMAKADKVALSRLFETLTGESIRKDESLGDNFIITRYPK